MILFNISLFRRSVKLHGTEYDIYWEISFIPLSLFSPHHSLLSTVPSPQLHLFFLTSRYFYNCVHICHHHNMSIKVVIDTNILVAGLIGRKGSNREILRQCFKGELTPVIGNALYLEYQELLHRENIQALCRQTTVTLEEFLDDFASIVLILWPRLYYPIPAGVLLPTMMPQTLITIKV